MQPGRQRSQMEIAFQRLEAHMSFICPECGELYQSQQQWRQHLNFHHDYLCKTAEDFGFIEINDRYHECSECNAMVADGKRAIALLQYHRFLHLPYSRTYRCRHCPASFTRKRVLCEHLCRHHESIIGEKVVAAATKKALMASQNMREGLSDIIRRPVSAVVNAKENPEFYMRYVCPQCGKQIDTYQLWMDHIKYDHSDSMRSDFEMQRVTGTKNHYCKICRKVVFTSDNTKLQRHYFSHLPHKVNFQCIFCKVRRTFKTELLHHFIRTHLKEFEMQRKYIRKPQEWGSEVNEQLDKELDILLKQGSSRGPINIKLTSTTFASNNPNRMSSSSKSNLMLRGGGGGGSRNGKGDLLQQALSDIDFIDFEKDAADDMKHKQQSNTGKRNWQDMKDEMRKRRQTKHFGSNTNEISPTKRDLEALCAEIFENIDKETENINRKKSNERTEKNLKEGSAGKTNNPDLEEEILSIEINKVDESEMSQFDDTESDQSEDTSMGHQKKRRKLSDSSLSTKKYPTLKSLFNAKVLHLCPKCGESFAEQIFWRDHVLTAHDNLNKMLDKNYKMLDDKKSNLCLTCMRILYTTDKSELQRHRFTHMPFHAYLKCCLCGTCKSNKAKMIEHLETTHASMLQSEEAKTNATTTSSNKIKKDFNGFEEKSQNSCKGEFYQMIKHLQNARSRLNRIATGVEIF